MNTQSAVEFTSEDLFQQFVFALQQRLRALQKAEADLFEFCYGGKELCENVGRNIEDVLDEHRKSMGISKSITTRFRGWLRAKDNIDPETFSKLPPKMAAALGEKVASDEGMQSIAKEVVEKEYTTSNKVTLLAKNAGDLVLPKQKLPKIDRPSVEALLSDLYEILSKKMSKKTELEAAVASARAKIESWSDTREVHL